MTDDLLPHPINNDWRYDPDDERGIVTDAAGRQVGVEFDGRVHNEHGFEIDADEQPVAEPDGTPLPPTERGRRPDGSPVPPHSGKPLRQRAQTHHTPSRERLARRFPALRR